MGCANNDRVSSAGWANYAEVAALILTRDGQAGEGYGPSGDSSCSLPELAAEITRQAVKKIRCLDLQMSEYKGFAGCRSSGESYSVFSRLGCRSILFDETCQLSQLIAGRAPLISESAGEALR